MAGSSSEELYDESTWVFYRDRIEWEDVKPVPQDDGEFPIVAISYSEKFADVHDYFRAVVKANEKSERALKLTKDALVLNPANYTVWQYRRDILKALGSDLYQELNFCRQMIEDNPKNYQVWHHRKVIVEWLNDPGEELAFTEAILDQDAKNYHAWQHRQSVMLQFKLYDQELDYVERLIDEDIRNNSAWNQRYFLVNNTTSFTPEILQREVKYTLGKIMKVYNNESAWNYLSGIFKFCDDDCEIEKVVRNFCEKKYEEGIRSPYLLGFLVDLLEDDVNRGVANSAAVRERAIELCGALANDFDCIRKGYWNFIADVLAQKKLNNNGNTPQSC